MCIRDSYEVLQILSISLTDKTHLHDPVSYTHLDVYKRQILCNAPNLYLDFAYNKHPQEPGLYWGGWVNERNTYAVSYTHLDVYKRQA